MKIDQSTWLPAETVSTVIQFLSYFEIFFAKTKIPDIKVLSYSLVNNLAFPKLTVSKGLQNTLLSTVSMSGIG